MGNPAWVRLDFSYKNLGAHFNPATFRLDQVTGAPQVDAVDSAGRHTGLSYLQFEHKGGLSSGTSYPKNDSQSFTIYGENMSATKAGIFTFATPLQPGESILLLWSTQGNGIDYGADIVALDNVKLRYIPADAPLVNLPPAIEAGPVGRTLRAGDSVLLSVAVTGTAPFTYQWSKNGNALAGATADTFAIPAAQSGDAGNYTVTVANTAGQNTSAAATLAFGGLAQTITFPGVARPWFHDGAGSARARPARRCPSRIRCCPVRRS